MTPDEQLDRWLVGDAQCPNDDGECCPDFSCCDPSIAASMEEKLAFVEGTDHVRNHLMLKFLARMAGNLDIDVHVAGEVDE